MIPVRGFTIVPDAWRVTPEELLMFDAKGAIGSMKRRTERAGALGASDWVIAMLDGLYHDDTGCFDLHLHGFAAGDLIPVIDELRHQRDLKSFRPAGRKRDSQVVRLDSTRLTNMPAPLTYRLKSYWMRQTYFKDHAGVIKPGRQTKLSPELEAYVLLWQDRWSLADITLMRGLEVVNGRLRRTGK